MFAECQKCKLLPLCAGGCAGKVYIASNRKDGVLNEKNCMFTEESLITYLKTYVEKMG
jgi:sulfatase maturation enzyme AslB (radical SAM superfamily)